MTLQDPFDNILNAASPGSSFPYILISIHDNRRADNVMAYTPFSVRTIAISTIKNSVFLFLLGFYYEVLFSTLPHEVLTGLNVRYQTGWEIILRK